MRGTSRTAISHRRARRKAMSARSRRPAPTVSSGRQISAKGVVAFDAPEGHEGSPRPGGIRALGWALAESGALRASLVAGRLTGTLRPSGVGSKGIQPYPGKKTSTQLCASREFTVYWWVFSSKTPSPNPLICRLGIERVRSMTFMAVGKARENTLFVVKREKASGRSPPLGNGGIRGKGEPPPRQGRG